MGSAIVMTNIIFSSWITLTPMKSPYYFSFDSLFGKKAAFYFISGNFSSADHELKHYFFKNKMIPLTLCLLNTKMIFLAETV